MGNIEQDPYSGLIDPIPCDSVHINLVQPHKWSAALERNTQRQTLNHHHTESLPVPLSESSVEHWHDTDIDTHHIEAVLNFSPDAVPEIAKGIWHIGIMSTLRQRLIESGRKVHVLPHEEASGLCVEVSASHFVHIQSTTDIQQCTINLQLLQTEELEGLVLLDFDTLAYGSNTDPYQLLRSFLTVWSHAIDTTVQLYGESDGSSPDNNHVIMLQPPQVPSQELVVTIEPQSPESPTSDELPDRVMFDDIAGYDDVKEKLKDLILLHKHPDIARDIGLESNHGILLHGPPGTGKTMILKALANEANARLVELPVSQVVQKWVGSSARNIDKFFTELMDETEPVVLLMDEFDALGVSNRYASSGERNDAVNRLKQHIIDINERHPNIILTAATNHIDRVDASLIRPGRLLPIEVHLPGEMTRREIWSLMLGQVAIKAAVVAEERPGAAALGIGRDIDAHAIHTLAERTNGMVGAHFKEIINTIRRQRLREYTRSGTIEPITQADLLEEINKIDLEP